MDKTNWFPAHIKPEHMGVYEVRNGLNVAPKAYCYWNGIAWGRTRFTVEQATSDKDFRSSWQDKEWRGVTEHD